MTSTTLQRLLAYPHPAVFEKGAEDELVFRLQHADGATWTIAGGVMTARAGALERSYNLAALTVDGLIDALRADGFDVVHVSSRFDGFQALVLTEGSGDQGQTNGDHVKAFTSLMWSLFTAYSQEVSAAEFQIRQALLQMVIGTAEGEWLDLWGSLYSVQRAPGETDVAYRIRIPREAFRLRVNALAIELAIKDLTGKDVQILEPWTEVFTLDESLLDGHHKFQDDQSIGYFFIQPFSRVPIDWSDVIPIIERNKPAGVLLLPPQVKYSGGAVYDGCVFGLRIIRDHTAYVRVEDLALLDYADIEETSVPNHPFIHKRTILHRSGAAIGTMTWPGHVWQPIPWNQLTYLVSSRHYRSYREYMLSAEYSSQLWPDRVWEDAAWQDINVVIGTRHTRLS